MKRLDIAFFESTLVPAGWNGAAPIIELIRGHAERGHRVPFDAASPPRLALACVTVVTSHPNRCHDRSTTCPTLRRWTAARRGRIDPNRAA